MAYLLTTNNLICLEFRFHVAKRGRNKGKDESRKANGAKHGEFNYQ